MRNLNLLKELLEDEIKPVIGCTEPASIAYAFSVAKNYLENREESYSAKVYLSEDVFRNASTVFVPGVKRIGIKYAVASGILSDIGEFNPFKGVIKKKDKVLKLAASKSWIEIIKTKKRGVYVKAELKTGSEKVSVIVEGRHDNIKEIVKNGKVVFRAKRKKIFRINSFKEIYEIVNKRNKILEKIVKNFMLKQGKNLKNKNFDKVENALYYLIRERMMGSDDEIITITGSGNQGISIFVPYYFLYKNFGERVLSALLFSVLSQIYLAEKNKRISSLCGLANKSDLSLISGFAYFSGKPLNEILKMLNYVKEVLKGLKCEGAKPSCALKGYICFVAVKEVLKEFNCYEKFKF